MTLLNFDISVGYCSTCTCRAWVFQSYCWHRLYKEQWVDRFIFILINLSSIYLSFLHHTPFFALNQVLSHSIDEVYITLEMIQTPTRKQYQLLEKLYLHLTRIIWFHVMVLETVTVIASLVSKYWMILLFSTFGFDNIQFNMASTASTHDQDVFSFYDDDNNCQGFEEVLLRYRELVPQLRLAG